MKQLLIVFCLVGLAIMTMVGGCGWFAVNMFYGIMEDKPNIFRRNYPIVRWCSNGLPFVDKLYSILDNKTYVVLLQNNTELRASGGFAGSFVKIQFEDGGLKDLKVYDIYQPDGQLPGHVEPPYPIQEAFGQGWWKLRDANWDPDFETTGETVAWFFEQGGVRPLDGIVAVNLDLIRKWLGILGQVESVTYGETVTAENIYDLAQRYAEENWTPGSTQKRDFLGAVGVALLERTKGANYKELVGLAKLVWGELKSGQVLLWFKDFEVQKMAEKRDWAGKMIKKADDYIYVVESNLGANKANCCIERKMKVFGSEGEGEVIQQIELEWKNNNPYDNPKPPESWGGDYYNYVRIVVAKEADVQTVEVGGKTLVEAGEEEFDYPASLRQGRSEQIYVVEEKGDFKTVGFWVVVPHGESVVAKLGYVRESVGGPVSVQIVRQPGILGWPVMVTQGKELVFEGWMTERERIFTSH